MSLKVELTLEKTELFFQENTRFEVRVTNIGTEVLTVLNPANAYTLPAFRVSAVKGGWEREFRKKPSLFSFEDPEPLAPRAEFSAQYQLLDHVFFPRPGEYDIVAIWEWNQRAGRTVSAPVRVMVRSEQPLRPSTVSAAGGPGSMHYSVWVEADGDQPRLFRVPWLLQGAPKLCGLQNLGPVEADAEPVPSVPLNGGTTSKQWVAWFAGDTLRIIQAESGNEPLLISQLVLSSAPKQIVSPLNHLEGSRGIEGRFFLWQGNNEGTVSRFQTVHLDHRGEAEAGANAILEGGRPWWMQAHYLTDGAARTYAVSGGPRLIIQGTRWGTDNKPEKVQTLWQTEGEFVAAGSLLASDDTVFGSLVYLEPGAQDSRRLVIIGWTQKPDGEFTVGEPVGIPRAPAQFVRAAVAAAGIHGEPVALIQFEGEDWLSFRAVQGLRKLPDTLARYDVRLEIIFPNSTDPLIKYAEPDKGFYYLKFDGSPAGPPVSG